jgi:hypothetical protein
MKKHNENNQVTTTEIDQAVKIAEENNQSETQTIETTEVDTNTLTAEQITEIKETIESMTVVLDAPVLDADAVIAHLAAIAKLHRKLTKPTVETKVTILPNGRKLVGETTEITCQDCGTTRTVKIQDSFQVTRCEECQKKIRNAKRAEKRKDKRAEIRLAKEADAALAAELLAKFKADQASKE